MRQPATVFFAPYSSPLGALALVVDVRHRLIRIAFVSDATEATVVGFYPAAHRIEDVTRVAKVARQLDEYFAGRRRRFELTLDPVGTRFQKQVWQLLTEIPMGETRSYGELARVMGRPRAARAVGRANATNPIPIVVPCHRVVGSSGDLTGFAGGLDFKRGLLELEGVEL